MEERNTIDRMAEFVRGGVEGADWNGPTGTAPNHGTPSPTSSEPAPSPVPTEVDPKLLGVDLERGMLYTSIGNFPLNKEQNRITKACLRVMKSELTGTYRRMSGMYSTPRKPRVVKTVKRRRRKSKAS